MKRLSFATLTAIAATLLLSGPALGQSRLYWGDMLNYKLNWSNTNGSNETIESLTMPPVELTVDQVGGWVYWLTAHWGHGVDGSLRRAPLHDLSQEELLVFTGNQAQGGLEVDQATGRIYWGIAGPNFSIVRTGTDSPDWEVWLPEVSPKMGGMDIDSKARLLFWTGGTSLMRAHLDRGVAEEVELDWGSLPPPAFDGGVALDTLYRKVYWAEQGSSVVSSLEGTRTRIFRGQYAAGGPPTLIYVADDARVTDLAFESVTRTLYWVESYLQDGATVLAVKKSTVDGPLPIHGTDVLYPENTPAGFDVFADPGAAELSAPEIDESVEVAAEMTVELSWRPVLGSPRYDVVVASDPDFQTIVYKENTPATKSEFVAPVAGMSYYWRIQSNACFIAPHWSETRMFTVVRLLSAVDLTSPENGAAGVTPYAAFAWAGLEGAASYEVEASSSQDFSDLVLADTTSDTQYTLDAPLAYDSKYYWRVRGVNTSGPGEWSDTWSFAVAIGTATEDPADVPTATRLLQPYPNPATTTVTIPFDLVKPGSVTIDVFDMAGRLLTVIEPGLSTPGRYAERIDITGWRSGAYVIILRGESPNRQFLLVVN